MRVNVLVFIAITGFTPHVEHHEEMRPFCKSVYSRTLLSLKHQPDNLDRRENPP